MSKNFIIIGIIIALIVIAMIGYFAWIQEVPIPPPPPEEIIPPEEVDLPPIEIPPIEIPPIEIPPGGEIPPEEVDIPK